MQKGTSRCPFPFAKSRQQLFDRGKSRFNKSFRPEGGRDFIQLNLGVLCDINHFPDHIAADLAGLVRSKRIDIIQVNAQLF